MQVMMALKEQQAASEELQLTVKILGMMKHSYLNNMDSLKSAIGEEVKGSSVREDEPQSSLLLLLLLLPLLPVC